MIGRQRIFESVFAQLIHGSLIYSLLSPFHLLVQILDFFLFQGDHAIFILQHLVSFDLHLDNLLQIILTFNFELFHFHISLFFTPRHQSVL